MIKQVRLDERLTHGQVNKKWISYLGATHVVVVDDESANDAFQTNLLKMSIPEKVKSMVVTCDKAIQILNDPRCERMNIFVVAKTPQYILKLVENVPSIKEVNLANYGYQHKADVPNKTKITNNLSLDEDDLRCCKEIIKKVDSCYHQVLSDTPKKPLNL